MNPMNTQAFLQTIGINVSLNDAGAPDNNNAPAVLSALQYLGVNTVRNLAPDQNSPATWAAEGALASAGVKFDFIIPGGSNVNIASAIAGLDAFEKQHPGSIAAIEGPNEINDNQITYNGITDPFTAGVQVTQDLWNAVKSDPTLSSIPVYNFSVSDGITNIYAGEAELGNLSGRVNYGNVHIYGSGGENLWSNAMPYWLPVEQTPTPGVPTVNTETGYGTSGQAGTDAVDQTVAAKYDLNTVFDEVANGIAFTYFYELVDSPTTSSHTYGFFNPDWSAKAPATALHNLTTILGNAGSGTAQGSLNDSLSGLPSTGHSFLLGSGTNFDLAVWNDVTIWNEATGSEIAAPAQTVTVSLGATYSKVSVFDPMVGTGAIATYSNVSSVPISLVDHPLIIQVAEGGAVAAAGPAATPTPTLSSAGGASANDTVINAGSGAAITDANGHSWTITGNGQVAVDNLTDSTTSAVVLLAYVNGEVWQENSFGQWYGKTQPTGEWGVETNTSPLPPSGQSADTSNTINVAASESSVAVTMTGGTVNAGSGDHMLFISGSGNTFNFGSGAETVSDTGSGSNTFNLAAAGSGTAEFNATALGNGDLFNLAAALGTTGWDGSATSIGSYLYTVQSGANSELMVSANGAAGSGGALLATFDRPNVALSTVLGHALT